MASKGKVSSYEAAIAALYHITRERKNPDDLWKAISSSLAEFATDQTIALVYGAAIEQALEIAIMTHFVLDADANERMFKSANDMPPIATLAVKISLAYALGVFEKHIRDELNLIKAIRNAFAHSPAEIDFNNEKIIRACDELWLPTKWKSAKNLHDGKDWSPKGRYIECVKILFLYLDAPEPGGRPKQFPTARGYHLLAKT